MARPSQDSVKAITQSRPVRYTIDPRKLRRGHDFIEGNSREWQKNILFILCLKIVPLVLEISH